MALCPLLSAQAGPAKAQNQPAPAPAAAGGAGSSAPISVDLSFGGEVKVDIMFTDTGYGEGTVYVFDYALLPGAIPIDPANKNRNVTMTARESRLWFKNLLTTPRGVVKSYVEADFLGFDSGLGNERTSNPSSLRLRHAYGSFGGLLVGQTWSTWMDLPSLHEVMGLGGPAGLIFARQAQIRYTHKIPSIGGEVQFALENPETTLTAPDGTRVTPSDDFVPDTIIKFSKKLPWGHVAIAGMGRALRADSATPESVGEDDLQFGFGARLSGKIAVGAKHNLKYDFTYGRGIGRYISLNSYNDGELAMDGSVELIDIVAGVVAAQVWFSEDARFALIGSFAQALNNSEEFATSNKRTITGEANIMWNVVDSVRFGIEYVFGRRTLENDAEGDMHRVHTSMRYKF